MITIYSIDIFSADVFASFDDARIVLIVGQSVVQSTHVLAAQPFELIVQSDEIRHSDPKRNRVEFGVKFGDIFFGDGFFFARDSGSV